MSVAEADGAAASKAPNGLVGGEAGASWQLEINREIAAPLIIASASAAPDRQNARNMPLP